jgi:autotransporter-associated beta strand protein
VIRNGALTQAGSKILVLSGANNYTGKTVVSAGVLDVRLSSSSAIQIDYDIATLRLENADNGGSV